MISKQCFSPIPEKTGTSERSFSLPEFLVETMYSGDNGGVAGGWNILTYPSTCESNFPYIILYYSLLF